LSVTLRNLDLKSAPTTTRRKPKPPKVKR
jgi:hypothetical protein